jgi:hypothetical protein
MTKLFLRTGAAVLAFSILASAAVLAAFDGISTYRLKQFSLTPSLATADRAIRLNGKNADALRARGTLYREQQRFPEAIKDFQQAVELRPRDHFLWLELGFTNYQAGHIEPATRDFEAAVSFAPYYAQPHWYLGNMFIQSGKLAEGFAELRVAGTADPFYVPEMIQKAVEVYGSDSAAIMDAANPELPHVRLALEQYFLQNQNSSAGMELFRRTSNQPAEEIETLLAELLKQKLYAEAYEVWVYKKKGVRNAPVNLEEAIWNGSFEDEIVSDSTGFGWQVARHLENTSVTRVTNLAHAGSAGLKITYTGASSPGATILSQLILSQPDHSFRLSVDARTANLITGGLPVLTAVDADSGASLCGPIMLPAGTNDWHSFTADCQTLPSTRAVIISLQRSSCKINQCPAFGEVWLDDVRWTSY